MHSSKCRLENLLAKAVSLSHHPACTSRHSRAFAAGVSNMKKRTEQVISAINVIHCFTISSSLKINMPKVHDAIIGSRTAEYRSVDCERRDGRLRCSAAWWWRNADPRLHRGGQKLFLISGVARSSGVAGDAGTRYVNTARGQSDLDSAASRSAASSLRSYSSSSASFFSRRSQ
jgi:hypothetical protein